MSYSKAGKSTLNLKVIYNKWRLASLGLDLAGLVTFFFALGMGGLTLPLMAVAVVFLWVGVVVSYKYVKIEEGKPFETVAKVSYFISMILALVLTVLTIITALSG
jgi:4-hydroxybenzoate polyprenyltransferase